MLAVLGVYARETGEGMIFSESETDSPSPEGPPPPTDGKRAKLTLVK
jgi:stringent starvation protein B